MKNPLNKRILREFRGDIGKYLVIFLFMVMLISLVSGFLVADHSVYSAYEEGFTKYNLEWGHFTLSAQPADTFVDRVSDMADVDLYELNYLEEKNEAGANIRVYTVRDSVNRECVMEGELPSAEDEIALDRMYAQNAGYETGSTITLNKKKLRVSGLIAVPDYSCLFENNTDMMFDSVNFSIAVMTTEGYQALGSTRQFYNYAWMYRDEPANDVAEKEASDDLLESVQNVLAASQENPVSLTDYVPRCDNQAIQFTGEDMGGDKAMFLAFDYIVIAILAFVFAITTSNTISQEAGVIGTLRASGYTKRELITHYMVLPILVSLVAAIIGNVVGYTALKNYVAGMYYNSYSLCTYETLWDSEAFVDTTVIPLILMFVINLCVLLYKMKLSPLDFLRRDLKRRKKKKAFRLNTKIPFLHRFRLRILFQNMSNYIVLFVGIQLAAIILIFGQMFTPLLDDYAELVENSMIAKYQYVMSAPMETENEQAEKYCMAGLETTDERYMTDEISVYGIQENSRYIDADISQGKVLASNGVMDKFGLKEGDTITLKDHYEDKNYDFVVQACYDYDAGMAIFMPREDYLSCFDEDGDSFTGYFTNEKLTDVPDEAVATIITREDLTKLSRQLKVSMGENMKLFDAFGVIMCVLLMYIISKQIIEKNKQSISMTKILGFRDGEIGGLYLVATSAVVIVSLLAAVPITDRLLAWMFSSYLYTEMSGYIPYMVSKNCFLFMILVGILCYAFVAVTQMWKIRRIPKSDALKNVE